MNSELWPIISCVIGVFLVISVGAFCRYSDWLSREADQSLAKLTANVLLPCLFVDRILWGNDLAEANGVAWLPPLFGFFFTAISCLLGFLIARSLGSRIGLDTDSKQRSFALCVGICNYGYIPLPLAMEFYPEAVVDLIMHNVGVDLALWSVGIAVIAGASQRSWHRAVFSPPLLTVIAASAVKKFVPVETIPGIIRTAFVMLGECTIPLGLLLSGAIIIDFLRDADWKGATRVVIAGILIRQGVFPVLMLLAGLVIIGNDMASDTGSENLEKANMQVIIMLQAAMPAAIFPIVLVRMYDRDTSTALRVVLPTSIAAIVLIPAWLAIGKWWFES